MTYHPNATSGGTCSAAVSGRESRYLEGVRRLCRSLLSAKARGEITLDARTQQRLEDLERDRYRLATERLLLAALAQSPELRQEYLELVRGELGIDGPVPHDAALLGELETQAQYEHDLAWSRYDRLRAAGVVCRETARRVWRTGNAHIARIAAQLTHVRQMI